eukprot:3062089-Ditylum_brightwellii.AAC.1
MAENGRTCLKGSQWDVRKVEKFTLDCNFYEGKLYQVIASTWRSNTMESLAHGVKQYNPLDTSINNGQENIKTAKGINIIMLESVTYGYTG